MKSELEAKLIKKYPKFFEYLKVHKGGLIMPMQFGFEFGDGWYVLVDSLMDCIHSYIESLERHPHTQIKSKFWRIVLPKIKNWLKYKKGTSKFLCRFEKSLKKESIPAPKIQLLQAKEKFGGLRFYTSGGDEYINGMIRISENMSYKICEFCGTTKDVGSTQGWIVTICKECFDKGKTNLKTWKPNEE